MTDDSVQELRAARARVDGAVAALRTMDLSERAGAIAQAAASINDDAELRAMLIASSGLSEANVVWGLSTTLAIFERDALVALARGAAPAKAPVTVVLAGNVFTACARPLLLPLLAGAGVIAKASSRDDGLAHALVAALARVDRRLSDACALLTFAHGERALDDELVRGAAGSGGLLNVYGSDGTVAAIMSSARALGAGAAVIGHGHGLGLCYVAGHAVSRETATAIATDVAAYDQRGCLSPQAIFVEGDGGVLAELLDEALAAREASHPRGALPADSASQQLQWRGVATAVGTLHEGKAHAVSHEGVGSLRASPGYRNLAVYNCDGVEAFGERAAKLGGQLKAVGVAGGDGGDVMRALAGVAPYVCGVGEMQRPGLAVGLDGLGVLAGVGIAER